MKKDKEIWKPVTDFKRVINDRYIVSNHGHVRDLLTDKYLNIKIANRLHHPYIAVSMQCINGKNEWVLVHQLVGAFFVKIPDELKDRNDLVPDHLDNNGLNNYYKNLEWKTRGQNVTDAFKMGFINFSGENHRDALITDEQAMTICRYLSEGFNYDQIVHLMDFPKTQQYRQIIVRIKNGLAWKHISSKYDFSRKSIQYSKYQRDTIQRLPEIQRLLKDGKTPTEVFDIVYKDTNCNRDTKINIIRRIRNKQIYKELLDP